MGYAVSSNKSKLKHITLSSSGTVASGGNETLVLQPDAGYIYKIIGMYTEIVDPSGSSTGSHSLLVTNEIASMMEYFYVSANTGSAIQIFRQGLGGTTVRPTEREAQFKLLFQKVIQVSNTYPVNFKYTNSTDVSQTAARTIQILVEETLERS